MTWEKLWGHRLACLYLALYGILWSKSTSLHPLGFYGKLTQYPDKPALFYSNKNTNLHTRNSFCRQSINQLAFACTVGHKGKKQHIDSWFHQKSLVILRGGHLTSWDRQGEYRGRRLTCLLKIVTKMGQVNNTFLHLHLFSEDDM